MSYLDDFGTGLLDGLGFVVQADLFVRSPVRLSVAVASTRLGAPVAVATSFSFEESRRTLDRSVKSFFTLVNRHVSCPVCAAPPIQHRIH